MKQKSEAQSYLGQVEMIESIIRNKLIEQRQWRDVALGITANMGGERVQSTGSQSKMADAVEKCVDMEREIDAYIDRLIDTKRDVIQTIEQLNSPIEYNVIHLRYIQLKTLQEIADHYGKEYGWVTTTLGRAVKNVQAILDAKKGGA